jgi:hypothetical protein
MIKIKDSEKGGSMSQLKKCQQQSLEKIKFERQEVKVQSFSKDAFY